MGIFSKFEGKVDDAFDGIAGSVFKSPIEPSQIAKRCEKQMHRNKLVGKGVQYAPTLYTVLVNADDDRRLFGFYPTMAGELETYLVGSASEGDLTLECRPLVRFIVDEGLKSGKFDVIAEVVTSSIVAELREEEAEYYGLDDFARMPVNDNRPRGTRDRDSAQYVRQHAQDQGNDYQADNQDFEGIDNIGTNMQDEPIDDFDEPRGAHHVRGGVASGAPATVPVANYGYPPAVLVNARTGESYALDLDNEIIGRDETSDITIGDASISRAHARLSRDDMGDWTITDLASTNGTTVNGRSIKNARLRFGDQITVGTTILLFQKG